ncbi:sensor histidine kinase [Promicromonospora iranensis]|uniref:sensor histidine kinase n=1 Tax=Promicromonospora iranensis TaxID=1105144 RepID=UPI0023A96F55|nr:sensor domain-containing protein [Promicromonospora iranensis]
MRENGPLTALEAVTWPRLLVSRWPWRSLVYLVSTLPLGLVAAALTLVPVVVLVTRWDAGTLEVSTALVLVVLELLLVVGLGPWFAPALARSERRRLRWVDGRPVPERPRPVDDVSATTDPMPSRYADPATWREVAWLLVLATAAPAAAVAALTFGLLVGLYAVSPLVLLAQRPGDQPVALGFWSVSTVAETVPFAIAGIVLLPVVGYVWTLVAGGAAEAARRLLVGAESEIRAELVEVSRSRARLADAFDAERRRIERDLHDGAQQRLVSLTLQLGLARLDVPPDSRAGQSLATAHDQAKELMTELRELIHGIQPQVLTDLGLPAALAELADRSPVPVEVDAELDSRPEPRVEYTVYFVVSEALANVAKHVGAAGTVRVTVRRASRAGTVTVEVSDDGPGGADPARGSGLAGLADRVAVMGGTMFLSSPPGGPTTLRAELPCGPEGAL